MNNKIFNNQKQFLSLLFFLKITSSLSSSECGNHGERKEPQEWISEGGFILLIIGVFAMFWGLAAVCEEYFVPSLNILCEELNIPDDVAGATFMAAGASSPEMFTSFIALFVNHSAIGVGTVVGSEIFNHMIICAGSVMYSNTGVLQLEKYIFTRDVLAYLISLIALIWSLKGSFIKAIPRIFDSDERKKCLDVTTLHAVGLVLIYFIYVLVSAYYQNFIKWMNNSSSTLSNSISKEENKYLQEKREMAENIINLTSRLLLDDEEVGAAVREEDRMASLLASVVEASVTTPITTNASIGITSGIGIGIGTNLNRSPASLHYSNSNSKPNSISVANSTNVPNVLLRSYQLQRASKYNPESISLKSTGGGIGIRTNRLPAVDWTQSRATFVNDAPLYTWRSSGVRLDYLEPFVENQVLTGNNGQNSKDFKKSSTTSYLSNSMCGYCCCFLNKSNELFISSVSPVQISAYLFLKITSKYHNIFNKWKLRYYTVDRWGFHSRKGRTNSPRGPHIRLIDFSDIISVVKIENTNYEFHLVRSDNTFLEFRATTEEIQNLMIERIQGHIDIMKRLSPDSKIECYKIARRNLDGGYSEKLSDYHDNLDNNNINNINNNNNNDSHNSNLHHGTIIDTPKITPGEPFSYILSICHYILYPLKFILYHTLPDVIGKDGRKKYIYCLLISIVWLAVLSFIMIMCCDGIGSYIGASPIVMGLTLSAIGTSFPNLWSSMLVARQGLGDMAVGNAFGSNTFNICIALGAPWLFRSFVTDFSSYRKMEDDGIVFMLILLIIVTILFYFGIMFYNWQIRIWMSYYFIATYFAIMIYAIING